MYKLVDDKIVFEFEEEIEDKFSESCLCDTFYSYDKEYKKYNSHFLENHMYKNFLCCPECHYFIHTIRNI